MTEERSLADLLQASGCQGILRHEGETILFRQRGVADLYDLLTLNPQTLRGADVADKVVGKGAAALLVLGGAKSLYAGVVSRPALELLTKAGISVTFGLCVPYIRNRSGNGQCPVETLCLDAATAEECLPLIRNFMERKNNNQKESYSWTQQ